MIHKFLRFVVNRKLDIVFSLLPIIIIVLLTITTFNKIPILDPLVIYRESIEFFNKGLIEFYKINTSVHPPLLYIINYIFFHIFGINIISYNIAGIFISTLTSCYLYFFLSKYFNKRVAILTTLLIFCNPITIVNTVFLSNDLLIMCSSIFLVGLYIETKYKLLIVALLLSCIMKETGYILVATMIFIIAGRKIYHLLKSKRYIDSAIIALISIWPTYLYLFIREQLQKNFSITEWKSWILEDPNRNSFQIIFDNIFHLKLFNEYLKINSIHAFIFNFQWVYSFLTISFLLLIFKKLTNKQKLIYISLLLLTLTYVITVFSFPTWTIIRYIIPVIPLLALSTSLFIDYMPHSLKYTFYFFLLCIVSISWFLNEDPVTKKIYQNTQVIKGTKFYETEEKKYYNGPDRIEYNNKFLELTTKEDLYVRKIIDKKIINLSGNCDELKINEKLSSIFDSPNAYQITNYYNLIQCKK